jgi:hypothetical protein
MADPVTLGVIVTGLVGAYKAYTEYRAAVVKARENGDTAPPKDAIAEHGEQIAAVVKTAMHHHGDERDRHAVENFEAEPDDYRDVLERKLTRLAERDSAVAEQLRTLAAHVSDPIGGVHGRVHIGGDSSVSGVVAGVNTGTIVIGERGRPSNT